MKRLVLVMALTTVATAACSHSFDKAGLTSARDQGQPEASEAFALRPGAHEPVINGVRLWYRVAGRADSTAPPVVFLHGGPGANSQSLAAYAGPQLERLHRMIYFDQRGSGRSERPWTKDYALTTLIADIEGLRRHLGVPQIALIGHSFGTLLALEYAAAHPQHVSTLVLAGSVGDAAATFRSMCARLKATNPEAFARAVDGSDATKCNVFRGLKGKEAESFFRSNMFPRPETAALVDASQNAGGLKNTGELQRAVFDAGLLEYRFQAHQRLTMPVLIISGGKDYQVGLEGPTALAARLPRARHEIYPEAGHFMFVDEPERFARDVATFLESGR